MINGWITPMEPKLTQTVPDSKDYIHQVKWDGVRGLCYIENGHVRIFTKKGRERTGFYPELDLLPSLLKAENAVLDGELIILNDDMKPSFQLSLIRERISDITRVEYYSKKYPASYIVFDIMLINGSVLTGKPLFERDYILRNTLEPKKTIAITDNYEDGSQLFTLMKEKVWEGIVSKKADSLYIPGKAHNQWFKTKLSRKILAVVAGLTMRYDLPNALVLAISGAEGFYYIGRASAGLSQAQLKLLKEYIPVLRQKELPFPANSGEFKGVVWLKPHLTVWISFLEWTSIGMLRHPKILGFTPLKPEEATGREFVD